MKYLPLLFTGYLLALFSCEKDTHIPQEEAPFTILVEDIDFELDPVFDQQDVSAVYDPGTPSTPDIVTAPDSAYFPTDHTGRAVSIDLEN